MGKIVIEFTGSFGPGTQTFSAEEGGHADAINRATGYLVDRMKEAIPLDHQLHDKGERPSKADFGKGHPAL